MNSFKLESVGKNLKDLKITLGDKVVTIKMFVESEENFRILQVNTSSPSIEINKKGISVNGVVAIANHHGAYKIDTAVIKEATLEKLNKDELYLNKKETEEFLKASSIISIDESGVVLRGGTITLN